MHNQKYLQYSHEKHFHQPLFKILKPYQKVIPLCEYTPGYIGILSVYSKRVRGKIELKIKVCDKVFKMIYHGLKHS